MKNYSTNNFSTDKTHCATDKISVVHDGFLPVCDEKSRLLILGSFPSVRSRKVGFYYGNPQNRFWKTVCGFFGENVPLSTDGKIQFLLRRRIALWDVVIKSDLSSSADSELTRGKYVVSDVGALIDALNLEKIIFNGKKSAELFDKNFKTSVKTICLPSTSSANVTFDENKWKEQLAFLLDK